MINDNQSEFNHNIDHSIIGIDEMGNKKADFA